MAEDQSPKLKQNKRKSHPSDEKGDAKRLKVAAKKKPTGLMKKVIYEQCEENEAAVALKTSTSCYLLRAETIKENSSVLAKEIEDDAKFTEIPLFGIDDKTVEIILYILCNNETPSELKDRAMHVTCLAKAREWDMKSVVSMIAERAIETMIHWRLFGWTEADKFWMIDALLEAECEDAVRQYLRPLAEGLPTKEVYLQECKDMIQEWMRDDSIVMALYSWKPKFRVMFVANYDQYWTEDVEDAAD